MNTVLEIFGYPNMKLMWIIIIPFLITPIYLIPTLGGRTCRGPIKGKWKYTPRTIRGSTCWCPRVRGEEIGDSWGFGQNRDQGHNISGIKKVYANCSLSFYPIYNLYLP